MARVGFMAPDDVGAFVEHLEQSGLEFCGIDGAIDIAVVDQLHGPTVVCAWLEFGELDLGGHQIIVARLTGDEDGSVATPDGWQPEGSMSANPIFSAGQTLPATYEFLGTEEGLEVYLDPESGQKRYLARTTNQRSRH